MEEDLPDPSMAPPESSPPGSPVRVDRMVIDNPNQVEDDLAEYFGEGGAPPEEEDFGEDLMDDDLVAKYVFDPYNAYFEVSCVETKFFYCGNVC